VCKVAVSIGFQRDDPVLLATADRGARGCSIQTRFGIGCRVSVTARQSRVSSHCIESGFIPEARVVVQKHVRQSILQRRGTVVGVHSHAPVQHRLHAESAVLSCLSRCFKFGVGCSFSPHAPSCQALLLRNCSASFERFVHGNSPNLCGICRISR
jgi:hypothetical protein